MSDEPKFYVTMTIGVRYRPTERHFKKFEFTHDFGTDFVTEKQLASQLDGLGKHIMETIARERSKQS